MKRTLLTAITLYLLYDRQKRVEARIKARYRKMDLALRHFDKAAAEWGEQIVDSHNQIVKEVNEAFKGIAGGKR